jgi:regulatory protein
LKDFSKALDYCFLLLKYRERSQREINYRLQRRGFSTAVIQRVIEYLRQNNYLNEERFAQNYIKEKITKGIGRRKIYFGLKKLGVDQQYIEEQIANIDEQDYYQALRKVIGRKREHYKSKKYPRVKLWRFLLQRGYYSDEIRRAISEN